MRMLESMRQQQLLEVARHDAFRTTYRLTTQGQEVLAQRQQH